MVSVSTLVHYLKQKLDQDGHLQRITVQGEISNFTNHRSGHWYFTLKDDKARISCVMFQSYARQCAFVPKDGDKVLLLANTSMFETSGQLQLYGLKMQLDGLGDLYLQFEKLKRRLNEEGLFDPANKKPIPAYPMKIGLITGKNTAAREDVISTLKRRWPIAEVIEFPVLVQGESAPEEICFALEQADNCHLDVLLLVRGGGSIEDLWAFNHEGLARKIVALNTPLICGVGHEVDVTIADYVADKRAPTPTGAAEMATPDVNEVVSQINKLQQRCTLAVRLRFNQERQQLNRISASRLFQEPSALFEKTWMTLDYQAQCLNQTVNQIERKRWQFDQMKSRLTAATLKSCTETRRKIEQASQCLHRDVTNKLQTQRSLFAKQVAMLDAYSPLKSLSRGYNLAYQDGKMMTSVEQFKEDFDFEMIFQDGRLIAHVLKKEINHE